MTTDELFRVATKVMGWVPFPYLVPTEDCPSGEQLWCPTKPAHISIARTFRPNTDPRDYMAVVEEMNQRGHECTIRYCPNGKVVASFWRMQSSHTSVADGGAIGIAICRAALAALEDKHG